MLGMQSGETMSNGANYGHRQTQSFAVKPSINSDLNGYANGSFHSHQPSMGGYGDRHPQRNNVPNINTGRIPSNNYNGQDMQTPQTGYDMNFTPLLPSQLLMGSPFQPGSPSTFQSPQFQSFSSFSQQQGGPRHQQYQSNNAFQHQQTSISPSAYQSLTSPAAMGPGSYFGSIQSPTTGFNALTGASMAGYGGPMQMGPGMMSGTSRTVYLGNIPPETSAEEILSHVRSGPIESVRLLPDKNCAFISFLDGSSATHFHSDAILKKLSIKGQDIKIGWGKPSSVPTSVALAVQQSGASRNVYLGNLGEDMSEEELREELSKFGPIDTVKLVREKSIGFVHFLSIGNAIKAVTLLPQEPKWQAPRRVYYGKDRCAYVSKTQQQNAAQYLGIAPGYAHVLNGADRDLITNALAQQSVAAAAVATTAGGVNNLGNRTVYLGNIHPETTIEEICNVVRGGLLHHIRYIPDKHICFVTFIDPTAAASFYALSNLQGLMIHNRRLKIGWGKHSGALPPAIALAVSGGASRNVYVGNLDESWTEDRLRQDFQEYGEIELVNTLREKSCAFVNFTNIANAIKAIEAVRGKEEYKRFKVNFGKDRCGNPPRQVVNAQQMQQREQQQQHENGLNSSSPVNGLAPSRTHNSISPASSGPSNGGYNPAHGPTASTIFNNGGNNPLTLYLAATQQSAQAAAEQQAHQAFLQRQDTLSPSDFEQLSLHPSAYQQSQGQSSLMSSQQAFYDTPNEVTAPRSGGLEPPSQHYSHGSHQSVNITNGAPMNSYSNAASQSTQQAQHRRGVSLPAFSLQQAQQAEQSGNLAGLGGYSPGGYGLGVSEGTLPGWAEEEVA
ncbi:Negative regulator of differentiation 1 [Fulvia fulva]|uniref:Negative regulator of differentiation 1 n=1 Tax=Passalora fulva TaxID=5499 RepID=A0A9Q8P8U2_PASFU|nr:Negative regulator of differentiation 1 [Fulvia fulva]KAK4624668.1 Negative regulator of differentiation 1 [Fulvia fulva]KAK4625341.1 Negative regulator of differentiation 1 [Fulvia fulva]UJO17357.1 Negative regulator of differentiation 1 [Fulvia fulva]WPV15294.1 Negative regulator of differentiation 1 [Fulvia fulva]WPV29510.1 Negative regulator of differentiation 1 [Fulvia fulva]